LIESEVTSDATFVQEGEDLVQVIVDECNGKFDVSGLTDFPIHSNHLYHPRTLIVFNHLYHPDTLIVF